MTFIEFLRKSDLTENLIQYVLLCISMTEENAPALQVKVPMVVHFFVIMHDFYSGIRSSKTIFEFSREV